MDGLSVQVGVDLVEIDRIEKILRKYADRFLNRLFGPEEIDYYRKGSQRRFFEGVSSLFAAKEAVRKVFLQKKINPDWRSVIISHAPDGRPFVLIRGVPGNPFSEIQLSLSHSGNMVIAVALGMVEECPRERERDGEAGGCNEE